MAQKVALLTFLTVVIAVSGSGKGGGYRLCAKFCDVISPVCGSDGKTYDSRCHLENAACSGLRVTFHHAGRCYPPNRCPRACPYTYNPVCGTNGKTYPNLCDLENDRNCNGIYVSKKHDGPCAAKVIKKGY
uniref:Kazal-type proteinase inhibitor n=1 Tax=Penaeus chinensis TaxID=139456 RepID=B8K254_PENCE|nr:kazal-type proteinase inhibitor [Penaeus chinensis]